MGSGAAEGGSARGSADTSAGSGAASASGASPAISRASSAGRCLPHRSRKCGATTVGRRVRHQSASGSSTSASGLSGSRARSRRSDPGSTRTANRRSSSEGEAWARSHWRHCAQSMPNRLPKRRLRTAAARSWAHPSVQASSSHGITNALGWTSNASNHRWRSAGSAAARKRACTIASARRPRGSVSPASIRASSALSFSVSIPIRTARALRSPSRRAAGREGTASRLSMRVTGIARASGGSSRMRLRRSSRAFPTRAFVASSSPGQPSRNDSSARRLSPWPIRRSCVGSAVQPSGASSGRWDSRPASAAGNGWPSRRRSWARTASSHSSARSLRATTWVSGRACSESQRTSASRDGGVVVVPRTAARARARASGASEAISGPTSNRASSSRSRASSLGSWAISRRPRWTPARRRERPVFPRQSRGGHAVPSRRPPTGR